MNTGTWIYLGVCAVGVILMIWYYRSGSFLKSTLFTAFSGFGALGAVWLLGRLILLPLAITPLTLLVAGLFGIPGVVAMLVLQLI